MRQQATGYEPRELPVYTIPDAAHYLRVPQSTLKSWVCGRVYHTADGGERTTKPLIVAPGSSYPKMLSFFNIVEAHILAAIRRVHGVPMPKVRRAIATVERQMHSPHPLIDARFQTDGIDLFIERYGELINQDGQLAIRCAIEASLKRIEWDGGLASKLYPYIFTEMNPDEPKAVVIDPRRAFGRPVIVGTGIQTSLLASRHRAGDSISDLAQDYHLPESSVENAIRCELRAA